MKPARTLPILALSALSFSIAQTAAVPAIHQMALALDTTSSAVVWTISANLAATAVLTPVAGRLGDMFGKRRALIATLLVFAVGSAVAALGDRVEVVIAGRIVQGAGGGVFPLCFGIVRDGFPQSTVVRSISLIASVLGLAAGLGLVTGGLLLDYAGWQWIFWIGAIMAIGAAALVRAAVSDMPPIAPGRIYPGALALLSLGLAAPMIGISSLAEWGPADARTLALFAGGFAVLAVWARTELQRADPLIDLRLLRLPGVPRTSLATLLVGFTLFGAFVVVAQAAQSGRFGLGLSATGAGLLMAPGCVAMLIVGSAVGPIGRRHGPAAPLAIGSGLSTVGLGVIALDLASFPFVITGVTVALTGLGLSLATVPNLVVAAVGRTRTGESTAVNVLIRSVGSAIGSQVVAALFATRTVDGLPAEGAYLLSIGVCAAVSAVTAAIAIGARRGADR